MLDAIGFAVNSARSDVCVSDQVEFPQSMFSSQTFRFHLTPLGQPKLFTDLDDQFGKLGLQDGFLKSATRPTSHREQLLERDRG